MKILAFDASTEALSAALVDDSGAIDAGEIFEIAPRAHARRLLPAAEGLLADAGLTLAELDALAFARGPGAFTGLRIAAGLVQGLALGTGLPVIAISTLAALADRAFSHAPAARRAQIVQDARMGEVYSAVFTRGDEPVIEDQERVLAPSDLTMLTGADVVRAGNGWSLVDSDLADSIADELIYPHALDVARLALGQLAAGEGLAPADAVPVYVRDDVARKPARSASM